ncbi:MAG: hypothetical protein GY742_18175 [Hyphomicrobiales bacterium]|nr:hypothetical protein [Hyphomicrobiales bacterium]
MNSNFDDEDAPLDPAVEKVRRKVMRLMGISIAIMMVGLMAVIGAIFYKISGAGGKKIATEAETNGKIVMLPSGEIASVDAIGANIVGDVNLPKGSSLVKADYADGRILLMIKSGEGDLSLWIYDLAANRVFAKIAINN